MVKNQKAQLTAIEKIELADCPMPVLGPDKVIVKVEYCGICGSDIHFFSHGCIGKKVAPLPFVLGHECSGTVVEVGEDVHTLKTGDRVALEPGIPCGKCEYCCDGRYNLCPDVVFMAAPPYDGALYNYLSHPANMCFKLPDHVTMQEGAMIEPLAVGLHAARRGGARLGKSVFILGSGTIGIMTLLACKAMGATQIIISDLLENRLMRAKEFGANLIINSSNCDPAEKVMEATNGQGCDIVFETAGSPITMAQTWKYVKRGGVIVVVGNISKETSYNFLEISRREVDIRPVFRYRNIYPLAIEAVSNGLIGLKGIQPKEFPLDQSQKAFDYTVHNAQNIIKTLIKVSDI